MTTQTEKTGAALKLQTIGNELIGMHPDYQKFQNIFPTSENGIINKLLTDNKFKEEFIDKTFDYTINGNSDLQDEISFDKEGKLKEEYKKNFKANLDGILSEAIYDGISDGNIIKKRAKQQIESNLIANIDFIRQNIINSSQKDKYIKLGLIDSKTKELMPQYQDDATLSTFVNSNPNIINDAVESNYTSFEGELSKSHNNIHVKEKSKAEAYAVYKKFGSEGLTQFFNLQSTEETVKKTAKDYFKTTFDSLPVENNHDNLLWSTVRSAQVKQESGGKMYDNSGNILTSSAGAVGISQIMPNTAVEISNETDWTVEQIMTDPQINDAAGEYYLNKMLNMFGGDYRAALASYNWGPGSVNKYIKKNGMPGEKLTEDEWVENIPVEETRNYVKNILLNSKTGTLNEYDYKKYNNPLSQTISEFIGSKQDQLKFEPLKYNYQILAKDFNEYTSNFLKSDGLTRKNNYEIALEISKLAGLPSDNKTLSSLLINDSDISNQAKLNLIRNIPTESLINTVLNNSKYQIGETGSPEYVIDSKNLSLDAKYAVDALLLSDDARNLFEHRSGIKSDPILVFKPKRIENMKKTWNEFSNIFMDTKTVPEYNERGKVVGFKEIPETGPIAQAINTVSTIGLAGTHLIGDYGLNTTARLMTGGEVESFIPILSEMDTSENELETHGLLPTIVGNSMPFIEFMSDALVLGGVAKKVLASAVKAEEIGGVVNKAYKTSSKFKQAKYMKDIDKGVTLSRINSGVKKLKDFYLTHPMGQISLGGVMSDWLQKEDKTIVGSGLVDIALTGDLESGIRYGHQSPLKDFYMTASLPMQLSIEAGVNLALEVAIENLMGVGKGLYKAVKGNSFSDAYQSQVTMINAWKEMKKGLNDLPLGDIKTSYKKLGENIDFNNVDNIETLSDLALKTSKDLNDIFGFNIKNEIRSNISNYNEIYGNKFGREKLNPEQIDFATEETYNYMVDEIAKRYYSSIPNDYKFVDNFSKLLTLSANDANVVAEKIKYSDILNYDKKTHTVITEPDGTYTVIKNDQNDLILDFANKIKNNFYVQSKENIIATHLKENGIQELTSDTEKIYNKIINAVDEHYGREVKIGENNGYIVDFLPGTDTAFVAFGYDTGIKSVKINNYKFPEFIDKPEIDIQKIEPKDIFVGEPVTIKDFETKWYQTFDHLSEKEKKQSFKIAQTIIKSYAKANNISDDIAMSTMIKDIKQSDMVVPDALKQMIQSDLVINPEALAKIDNAKSLFNLYTKLGLDYETVMEAVKKDTGWILDSRGENPRLFFDNSNLKVKGGLVQRIGVKYHLQDFIDMTDEFKSIIENSRIDLDKLRYTPIKFVDGEKHGYGGGFFDSYDNSINIGIHDDQPLNRASLERIFQHEFQHLLQEQSLKGAIGGNSSSARELFDRLLVEFDVYSKNKELPILERIQYENELKKLKRIKKEISQEMRENLTNKSSDFLKKAVSEVKDFSEEFPTMFNDLLYKRLAGENEAYYTGGESSLMTNRDTIKVIGTTTRSGYVMGNGKIFNVYRDSKNSLILKNEFLNTLKQEKNFVALAQVEFEKTGRAIISSFKNSNVSSGIHEMAHIFRRYLSEDAQLTILKWAKSEKFDIETEEKFARAFEKYLQDGIAPSVGLKSVFENFKLWLKEIYQGIGLDVEVSSEMKKLFDSVLTIKRENEIWSKIDLSDRIINPKEYGTAIKNDPDQIDLLIKSWQTTQEKIGSLRKDLTLAVKEKNVDLKKHYQQLISDVAFNIQKNREALEFALEKVDNNGIATEELTLEKAKKYSTMKRDSISTKNKGNLTDRISDEVILDVDKDRMNFAKKDSEKISNQVKTEIEQDLESIKKTAESPDLYMPKEEHANRLKGFRNELLNEFKIFTGEAIEKLFPNNIVKNIGIDNIFALYAQKGKKRIIGKNIRPEIKEYDIQNKPTESGIIVYTIDPNTGIKQYFMSSKKNVKSLPSKWVLGLDNQLVPNFEWYSINPNTISFKNNKLNFWQPIQQNGMTIYKEIGPIPTEDSVLLNIQKSYEIPSKKSITFHSKEINIGTCLSFNIDGFTQTKNGINYARPIHDSQIVTKKILNKKQILPEVEIKNEYIQQLQQTKLKDLPFVGKLVDIKLPKRFQSKESLDIMKEFRSDMYIDGDKYREEVDKVFDAEKYEDDKRILSNELGINIREDDELDFDMTEMYKTAGVQGEPVKYVFHHKWTKTLSGLLSNLGSLKGQKFFEVLRSFDIKQKEMMSDVRRMYDAVTGVQNSWEKADENRIKIVENYWREIRPGKTFNKQSMLDSFGSVIKQSISANVAVENGVIKFLDKELGSDLKNLFQKSEGLESFYVHVLTSEEGKIALEIQKKWFDKYGQESIDHFKNLINQKIQFNILSEKDRNILKFLLESVDIKDFKSKINKMDLKRFNKMRIRGRKHLNTADNSIETTQAKEFESIVQSYLAIKRIEKLKGKYFPEMLDFDKLSEFEKERMQYHTSNGMNASEASKSFKTEIVNLIKAYNSDKLKKNKRLYQLDEDGIDLVEKEFDNIEEARTYLKQILNYASLEQRKNSIEMHEVLHGNVFEDFGSAVSSKKFLDNFIIKNGDKFILDDSSEIGLFEQYNTHNIERMYDVLMNEDLIRKSNHLERMRFIKFPDKISVTDLNKVQYRYSRDVGNRLYAIKNGLYDERQVIRDWIDPIMVDVSRKVKDPIQNDKIRDKIINAYKIVANLSKDVNIGANQDDYIKEMKNKRNTFKWISGLMKMNAARVLYRSQFYELFQIGTMLPFITSSRSLRKSLIAFRDTETRKRFEYLIKTEDVINKTLGPMIDVGDIAGPGQHGSWGDSVYKAGEFASNFSANFSIPDLLNSILPIKWQFDLKNRGMIRLLPFASNFDSTIELSSALVSHAALNEALYLGKVIKAFKMLPEGKRQGQFLNEAIKLDGYSKYGLEEGFPLKTTETAASAIRKLNDLGIDLDRINNFIENLDELNNKIQNNSTDYEDLQPELKSDITKIIHTTIDTYHGRNKLYRPEAAHGDYSRALYQFSNFNINLMYQTVQKRMLEPIKRWNNDYAKYIDSRIPVSKIMWHIGQNDFESVAKMFDISKMTKDGMTENDIKRFINQAIDSLPTYAYLNLFKLLPAIGVGTTMTLSRAAIDDMADLLGYTITGQDDKQKEHWKRISRLGVINPYAPKKQQVKWEDIFEDENYLQNTLSSMAAVGSLIGNIGFLGKYGDVANSMLYGNKDLIDVVPVLAIPNDAFTSISNIGKSVVNGNMLDLAKTAGSETVGYISKYNPSPLSGWQSTLKIMAKPLFEKEKEKQKKNKYIDQFGESYDFTNLELDLEGI